MFSYFEKGIKDTIPSRFIGLPELVQLIRYNPNKNKIETIRLLRKDGDELYRGLKSELSYITPVCMVRERSLEGENFEKNFIQFSQYLYYDIDTMNAEDYKCGFLRKYGHLASMVCISSSGGGISVLFKVRNEITKANFKELWQKVRDTMLKDETIDTMCSNVSRAMYISYDPEVYVNYENSIEIELINNITKPDEKVEKQGKTRKDFNITLIYPYSILPINKVLEKLKTSTMVPVSNPVVDFKPAEIVQVFIPSVIKDRTKHRIFKSMIHTLVYLNPDIDKEYIFSYLFYINRRFAKPRMEKREFVRYFNMVYNGIKNHGVFNVKKEVRYIHFNSNCELSTEEKYNIANMLNGFKRKNESIQKIINAKGELKNRGVKITQRNIAALACLSVKTVRTHLNSSLTDMDELVAEINISIPIKNDTSKYQDLS